MRWGWQEWLGKGPTARRVARDATPRIEALEPRRALSATPANVPVWRHAPRDIAVAASTGNTPQGTAGPRGFTPAQIRHAYGLDGLSFGGTAADGTGTTIAIVTAYDAPNLAADLTRFDAAFSLPAPPRLTKVNQSGGTRLPAPDAAWATETCIDVQWAHAIAPGASILVVEATSNSDADLMAAVNQARCAPGVVAVSMSWGRLEYAGETIHDATFTTPAGHVGVTFFAASGDSGAPSIYPAMSRNVVSVGGTSLALGPSGEAVERGWSGSGGGVSTQQGLPSWQAGVVPAARRAGPDVALVGDPATGLAVCDSFSAGAVRPWAVYGGTSIAAPQWAGLAAIVAQGRALRGSTALDGATQFLPALYALPSADFRDITLGSSRGRPVYAAGPGWDFVTGRGSPVAGALVRDLVAWDGIRPKAPAAPGGFSVADTGSTSVTLAWTAAAGAEGYRLYEIAGTTATLVASYGPGVTTAVVGGLMPKSTHSWRLDAWNGGGVASASVTATLAGGVAAPTGLVVKVLSRDSVQVSWNGVPGATSYAVYALEGATLRRVGGTNWRQTTLRVTGLMPRSTVFFAVRAEDATTSATAGWVKVTLPG